MHAIFFSEGKITFTGKKSDFRFYSKTKADAILNICSLTYRTFANFLCRAVSGSSNSRNDVCYHAKYFKNAICTFNWNFDRVYRIGSYLWSLYWLCRGKFSDLYGKSKTGSFIYYSFSALQQIEGNLIYPHVVGGSVGLPSIWVLAAVTIGGNLMGIIGMLIFIPLVSVFYTIFREFVYLRLKKQHIKRVTRTDVEEYAEEEIASSFIVPNEK